MKQINLLKYVLISIIFIYATACDKNDPLTDILPEKVLTEFVNKFPNARMSDYSKHIEPFSSAEMWKVSFADNIGMKSNSWFNSNGSWKLTYTELNSIDDLTFWAKRTFMRSEYADANIEQIYKTERDGLLGSLYTLYFISSDNVGFNLLINDDGLFLNKTSWSLSAPSIIIDLPQDHFNFINDRYNDAEIRSYFYDFSEHEYIIKHEGKIKFVTFDWEDKEGSWKQTRYELDKNYQLPDNVIKYKEKNFPDFEYTNIYYIELDKGNEYLLMSEDGKNKYGYHIREDA